MTEVTFYLSEKNGPLVRAALAWRIADKAVRQGRQVFVLCRDPQHAQQLDELYWNKPATGFLPHCLNGEGLAPVVLGFDQPGDHHDVLINLTDQVPDFASRFQRVAEMISGETTEKQQGRERFRFYRERGFPLTTHKLGQ